MAVIFYTTYGTNHEMAQVAADAARKAGAEVRLRRVPETAPKEVVQSQDRWSAQLKKMQDIQEVSPDDMEWADGYVFSAPTRYGGAASQMRAFIDTLGPLWQEGKLADKTFTAMSSAMNAHGGQETTLQTLYITAMHWGTILVPPGYTDPVIYASGGNPYGATVTTGGDGVTDEIRASIRHQAERLVEVTEQLVAGRAAGSNGGSSSSSPERSRARERAGSTA
ncbi:MAG TPA: NAD(P)H:quinone oxidoreductase [Longimicrobiales bacterium]|nr:NAD(P)H:quinone oxidoreductase [Longimicrobiales bacterium]